MLDIGFPELLVVATLALLVLGPERLPEAIRTLGLWYANLRQAANRFRMELEQEVGAHEIRQRISESREAAQQLEQEFKQASDIKDKAESAQSNTPS